MIMRMIWNRGDNKLKRARLAVILAIACLVPATVAMADLLHNSADTGSTKWSGQGGWGVPGGKYGEFTCDTCHETNNKANIKNVRTVISSPDGTNLPNGAPSVTVVLRNITSHGDDSSAHAASNRICEVCHSANRWHNYNTANNSGGLGHPTPKQVCTNCHVHSTGFKAACGGCHGNPPTTPDIGGDYGLVGTPRASNALQGGRAGAHFTHTDPTRRALVCDTCHNVTNGSGKMPGQSGTIQLGFFGFGGTVTSGTYTPFTSATRGYPIVASAPGTTIAPGSGNYATANLCSNLYCHGGGAPGRAPLTGGTNQTPRWDGVGQSACGSCHGASAANPPTTGNHLKHAGSTIGYSYSCDLCHPATDISHVQGNMRWQFQTSDPRIGAAAGYQANGSGVSAATGSTNNLAPSIAYGQCSNLYCHGTTTPTWGTTLAADCTGCHGNDEYSAAPMVKNAHKAHIYNRSARFDHFDFKCQECHANTVDSTNLAISNKSQHVNTTKDVAWGPTATRVGVQAYNGTGASCATTYCHSNGRDGAPYVTPANWTTVADGTEGTYSCNACHGGFAGQANPMATARHANHITTSPAGGIAHKGIACDKCHDMTVGVDGQSIDNAGGLHINKSFNVTFAKFANRSGNYTYGTQTCQNTYCHGRATNAVWTTTAINNCGSCHRGNNSTAGGALSRAHVKHYNSGTLPLWNSTEGWTNANRSVNTNVFMCGTCHAVDPNTQHLNGPAMPNGAAAELAINLPFSVLPARQYPAGGVPVITRGTTVVADGANYFYSQQTTCAVYCHSNGRGGAPINVMQWDNSTTTCGNCHNRAGDANPTWSGAHSKHLTSPVSTAANCGTCHAATASTNNVLIGNRRDRHPNGFINVTGNSVASGAMRWNGTNCTNAACHFNAPTPAWEGGRLATRCSSCHGSTAVSGVPITKNAHKAHVANTSPRFNGFNFGCRECHSGVVYDNNTSIQNTALHVNGTQNVAWGALATTTGSTAYNAGACSATYCHSDGNGNFRAPTNWRTVADSTEGTVGCNYCHGGTKVDGTSTIMADERHFNHVMQSPASGLPHAAIGCDKCHDATVGPDGSSIDAAAGTHLNKVRNINFAKFANRSGSWVGGTRRCDNTYCHGRNNPTWGTATINNCASCHRSTNTTTNGLSNAHIKHFNSGSRPDATSGWTNTNASTDTAHVFYCGTCHNVPPATDHVNGPATANGAAAQVVFNIPRVPAGYTRGNTFTYGTGQNLDGSNYIYSSGTTCDVYCHSDGNNGPSKQAFNWTVSVFTCGACHNNQGDGAASPSWSAPHTRHIRGYAEGGNPNFGCVACHRSTTTNGTTILSRRVHINGYRNVSTSTWAGGSWNGSVCANVYCHSDGKATPTYVTGQGWTTVAANCLGCHGGASSNGGNNSALSGKHAKHVNGATYAMKCSACHYKTASATDNLALKNFSGVRYHVNKTRDVTLSATYGGSWTSPSCTSVYCHSNGVVGTPTYANPNWSSLTTNCTSCHGGAVGSASVQNTNRHGSHMNNIANLGANFSCNVCHAATVSSNTAISAGGYAYHVNKLRDVNFGSYSGTTGGASPAVTCSSTKCHAGRNPAWNAAVTGDHRCVKCHGAVGATNPTPAQLAPGNGRDLDGANNATSPTKDIQIGTHQQHLGGPGSSNIATVRCIECHTVPNNATDNNHLGRRSAEVTFGNASAAGKNGAVPAFTLSSGSVAGQCSNVYCHGAAMPNGDTSGTTRLVGGNSIFWNQTSYRSRNATPTTADCAVCHGNPPTAGATASTHADYISQPTTSCTGCHTHFNSNGTLNNPALHINGKGDASGGNCNSCHDYDTVGAVYAAGIWSGGRWGKNAKDGLTPNEGWGAHAKHINYIKSRIGYAVALDPVGQTFGAADSDPAKVCGTCHTTNPVDHTIDNSSKRKIFPAGGPFMVGGSTGTSLIFGTTDPVYNGDSGTSRGTLPKTCSNISCHYFTTPNW